MAITTLDGAIAGMQDMESIFKVGVAMKAAGLPHSHFYSTGRPGAGTAPSSGVNGGSHTAPLAGCIPHTNPGANAYLARLAASMSVAGQLWLIDRLWTNSGLSTTSTSAQAISPGATPLPARDRDGSTNGVDVLVGLEWSAAGGAGTPTETLTYTDSDGNTGVTTTLTATTTPNAGTLEVFPLAAGDLGVRACTSFQHSATRTSGTFHILMFRILAVLELTAANIGNAIDVVTSGMPRIYNGSCLALVQVPSATTATNIAGQYIETHG